jgi:hypothetical protein
MLIVYDAISAYNTFSPTEKSAFFMKIVLVEIGISSGCPSSAFFFAAPVVLIGTEISQQQMKQILQTHLTVLFARNTTHDEFHSISRVMCFFFRQYTRINLNDHDDEPNK